MDRFHGYLNETGRAGFVMSSQASSAGGSEAVLRRRLVETGDVDVMIVIRSNFFYTRTVPCELWFLDRAKPEEHRGKVLMIDARNVYRKVTRKICDFSPEQQRNLLAIVWLYRGEAARFLALVSGYLREVVAEGRACFEREGEDGATHRPLPRFLEAIAALHKTLAPFLKTRPKTGPHAGALAGMKKEQRRFAGEVRRFESRIGKAEAEWKRTPDTAAGPNGLVDRFAPLAGAGHDLAGRADRLCQLAARLIETCERECDARSSNAWNPREITRARKAADEARRNLTKQDEPFVGRGQLRKVHYFWRQARWLTERFPDAKLRDAEGLVKLVDRTEIEASDWSLTPGRYVGVAPEEEDESFDFRTALREVHAELWERNAEAAVLAAKIRKNFEGLGIGRGGRKLERSRPPVPVAGLRGLAGGGPSPEMRNLTGNLDNRRLRHLPDASPAPSGPHTERRRAPGVQGAGRTPLSREHGSPHHAPHGLLLRPRLQAPPRPAPHGRGRHTRLPRPRVVRPARLLHPHTGERGVHRHRLAQPHR